jgi:hypothetical protein
VERGRRLFSTAAVLMILTAGAVWTRTLLTILISGAHTAGSLASGMGMDPSVYDIYWDLALTMSITFAALGVINLLIAAAPSASGRLLRNVGWANAVWVAAFLILNAANRISPALICAGIVELFVIASLVTSKRASGA